ncbi:MAG: hypothetical protein KF752_19190 [Pirellulaceae bacterium]|nr:hypothetical protein [Pirellulaceae bacterium]
MSDHWKSLADRLGSPRVEPSVRYVPEDTSSAVASPGTSASVPTPTNDAKSAAPLQPEGDAADSTVGKAQRAMASKEDKVMEKPRRKSSWEKLAGVFGLGGVSSQRADDAPDETSTGDEAPAAESTTPRHAVTGERAGEGRSDQRRGQSAGPRDRAPQWRSGRDDDAAKQEFGQSTLGNEPHSLGDAQAVTEAGDDATEADSRRPRSRRGRRGRGDGRRFDRDLPSDDASQSGSQESSKPVARDPWSSLLNAEADRGSADRDDVEVVSREPVETRSGRGQGHRDAEEGSDQPQRRSSRRRRGRGRDRDQGPDRGGDESTVNSERPARRYRDEPGADVRDDHRRQAAPEDMDDLDDENEDLRDDQLRSAGDAPGEVSESPEGRGRRRRRRPRGGSRSGRGYTPEQPVEAEESAGSVSDEIDNSDVADDPDADDSSAEKHRNIPTWDDALMPMIQANMDNHRRGDSRGSRARPKGRR